MPWFVLVAKGVIAGKGKCETELGALVYKPPESARRPKYLVGGRAVRRANVDRSTGMVFAEARRGKHAEDLVEGLAFGELCFDQFHLAANASKGRYDADAHLVLGGSLLQGPPSLRRFGRETVLAPVGSPLGDH